MSDRDPPLFNTEIYVMNADGSGIRRLTNHPLLDDWPAWSPDGAKIVFSRGPDQYRPEIHVMNADGSGTTRITTSRRARARPASTFSMSPRAPRAGKRLTVSFAVRIGDLGRPSVACQVIVGGRRLTGTAVVFSTGSARCTWVLPRTARGKRLRGSITLRFPVATITRTFSARVR